MKISLLFPSRGRPDKAKATLLNWLQKSGGIGMDIVIENLVSVDTTDPSLNRYKEIFRENLFINNNSCVVEATNYVAKKSTGDILIYLSEDFDAPDKWVELVLKEFADATGPRLIKVDDCLQPFPVKVLTIPMMNRALYERLGYFWHPEYRSMFVDEDLYHTAAKLGALKMCPHLKFEHKHVSVGKAEDDETYRRSSANWNQGQEVFNRRKRMGFPV